MEHNKDIEWLEMLAQEKSFASLTTDERRGVLETLGSEEEYNVFRKVSRALVAEKADLSPDPRILRSLADRFRRRENSRSIWTSIANFKVPAYAVVILLLIAVVATTFVSRPRRTQQPQTITLVRNDTVYLEQQRDTVYVERVVYRDRQVIPDNNYHIVKSVVAPKEGGNAGVTMKDKEELEKLLVSGS